MLLDLAEKHRGAVEYDWRTRFHIGFHSVPLGMSWGEAWRMVQILLADPSSHLGAEFRQWDYPISREDMTLRTLYDLQHQSKAKRRNVPPLSRPWLLSSKRLGAGTRMSIAEFEAMKARLN